MKAYSLDLRERVVQAVAEGLTPIEAAGLFDIGLATVKRYRARLRTQGTLAPASSPGRPRSISRADEPALLAQLEAMPDATLEEHCTRWEETHAVRVSVATMQRAITRLSWTLNKRPSTPRNKTRSGVPNGVSMFRP